MDFSISMSIKPGEHLPLVSLFYWLLVGVAKKQADKLAECFFLLCFFCSVSYLLYLFNVIPTNDIAANQLWLKTPADPYLPKYSHLCNIFPQKGRKWGNVCSVNPQPRYLSALTVQLITAVPTVKATVREQFYLQHLQNPHYNDPFYQVPRPWTCLPPWKCTAFPRCNPQGLPMDYRLAFYPI